eukprot:CAMPEP_0172637060 /NCGR_PEP_ID=MMETSP1068-20121228/207032_1 /TAXON_ID=35684 /ORGANISM="Pseudopedinella elastica, Strain CCMP716" /LENGTH=398 /DNA_ID=CAMNT_0013449617 /DNA_START=14 /DNA_END=1206 /DNA_ORIENTATION=-
MSVHDDGLYPTFYADYASLEARLEAEQELLFSVLDQEREALEASGVPAESKSGSDDEDDEDGEKKVNILFKDPDFKAAGSSLYNNPFQAPRGAMPADMIEWNRLGKGEVEGMTSPALFGPGVPGVEEVPTTLVHQGALKNCWFIGACAILATKPALVKALFVSDQQKFGPYAFYTVRFFKCGLPRYVHLDDRIPCTRAGRPHYARTNEPNEYWLQLVEKAYAKLHGGYENLTMGALDRGLRDLTGWPTFKHSIGGEGDDDDELWETLVGYTEQPGSLVSVEYAGEGTPGDGILANHCYAVLEMKEVSAAATADFDALDVRMVKLHNPWGMAEWTGDWSTKSELWANYPEIHEQCHPQPGGAGDGDGKKAKKKKKAKTDFEVAAEAAAAAAARAKEEAS